ncbi:MAG: biopolymer transport protein ExbB [Myxococcota bacterium]|jgi:biopolymer transport protein ExbB
MLEEKLMSFSLMGAEWVLWLLVGLSVLCFGVAVERWIYQALNRSPRAALQGALNAFLTGGSSEDLTGALKDMKGMEARVLSAGLEAALEGGSESAEEVIAGNLKFEKQKLSRGLIIIGTTGSNAPFVGLFGTVLGIIKAFHDLGVGTDEAATAVMGGISEALVATAVGLMVAIPAVVLYNYFQTRNKSLVAELESMSHLLLSRFKGHHAKTSTPRAVGA